ncbi:MAG: radical SAM protein [Methanobacteriota archaeon]|nr:MAG: radical SAM protein [Euryarchaeota archaeon]
MSKTVDCYFPGTSFPSVSVTGGTCALDCKHCSGVHIERMLHARDPDALLKLADRLNDTDAIGFLLTGGSNANGKVPLSEFAGAIKTIKESTELRINAHVGLMPKPELEELVSAGVDAFSTDVYGSDSAIRTTLGLNASCQDFLSVIADLSDIGAPVIAPHICVGIEGGEIVGENTAIEALAPYAPDAVVIIAFVPTKGTAYEHMNPPSNKDVLDIIDAARRTLPRSRLLLGCMRQRVEREWEEAAVKAGLDGIAVPSRRTMHALSMSGWRLIEKRMCCAIE